MRLVRRVSDVCPKPEKGVEGDLVSEKSTKQGRLTKDLSQSVYTYIRSIKFESHGDYGLETRRAVAMRFCIDILCIRGCHFLPSIHIRRVWRK